MKIEETLLDEADHLARKAQGRVAQLEAQLKALERHKLEVEAQYRAARLAPKRLLTYSGKLGTEYQCPRCWIADERKSLLRPINGTNGQDILRCGVCQKDVLTNLIWADRQRAKLSS